VPIEKVEKDMTRNARVESATGIYHVMMRGINKQDIFEFWEDYERFKNSMHAAKEKSNIKLFGYCLMSNHIHAIVGTGSEPIGTTFKRLGVSYAIWFNHKYKRQGTLFQDRFRSEPIEDDTYLLSALRYIHQNPISAGLCSQVKDYRWSSFADYQGIGDGLTDTDEVLEMFSENVGNRIELFTNFMENDGTITLADIDNVARPTDEALREKVTIISGVKSISEFQSLAKENRDSAIRTMRNDGMSMNQIVRLTGIPLGIVRKISKVRT